MAKIPDWATVAHDDIEKGVEVRLNHDGTGIIIHGIPKRLATPERGC